MSTTLKSKPIGEVLLERTAISGKIKDLQERITNNSISTLTISTNVIEPCNEDVADLLKELEILQSRYQHIWKAITLGNYETKVMYENKEYHLIEIIDMIDELNKNIRFYKELLTNCDSNTGHNASVSRNRSRYDYSSSSSAPVNDTKQVSMIPLKDLREKIAKLISKKNSLQVLLQEVNWSNKINV